MASILIRFVCFGRYIVYSCIWQKWVWHVHELPLFCHSLAQSSLFFLDLWKKSGFTYLICCCSENVIDFLFHFFLQSCSFLISCSRMDAIKAICSLFFVAAWFDAYKSFNACLLFEYVRVGVFEKNSWFWNRLSEWRKKDLILNTHRLMLICILSLRKFTIFFMCIIKMRENLFHFERTRLFISLVDFFS